MGTDHTNRVSFKKTLALIVLIAAFIRVVWLIQYSHMPDWTQLTVDNNYHLHWAQDIASGNVLGDTTYFRAPFYVYCLALLTTLFGSSLWVGRLFGLAIGLVSVLTTGLLGRRLFLPRVGLIAAALHAVYPLAVYFESELLLDPLFLLLFELAVYRLAVWLDTGRGRDALLTGLLVGLAAITRPTALILVPIILLLVLLHRDRFRPMWRSLVLAALGMVLMIAPISVRNMAVADDPVAIASQGGINLYIGNNDAADGVSAVMPMPLGYDWEIRQVSWIAEKAKGHALKPGEVSSYWTAQALDWIGSHPGRFMQLYAAKLYRNISNREISNNRDLDWFFARAPFLSYNPVSFGLVFAFALLAILTFAGSNRQVRLLVLVIVIYVAASALFFFNSRFRLPLLPFFFVLAGLGISIVIEAWKRSVGSVVLVFAVVVAAAAISFAPLAPLPPGASPQAILAESHQLYNAGDFAGALRSAREAARIDSAFPGVNVAIGNAALRMGDAERARTAFEEEATLHPDRPRAYANLASMALIDGRPADAISYAQRAIRLEPWDQTTNRVLLRAYFLLPALSEADLVDRASQAATRTKDDIYVLNETSELFAGRQSWEPAVDFAHRAINAHPPAIETSDDAFRTDFHYGAVDMNEQRARAAYQLGYVYGVTGVLNESITYSRRAIELDSTMSQAYVNLVSGYLSTGQRGAADSVLADALRRFPGSPPLHQLQSRLQP